MPIFRKVLTAFTMALALPVAAQGESSARNPAEWSYFGGSHRFDRYSPLAKINAANVKNMRVLWTRPAVDKSILDQFPDVTPSPYLRGTPIMIGGVLYASNGIGLVEAFDAATGRTIWVQKPFAPTFKEVAGQSVRGLDYWRNGREARIISVRGEYLYALNAKDGSLVTSFGNGGRVSLNRDTPDKARYFNFNGPIVVGDVIVVGGNGGGNLGQGFGDFGLTKEARPEDIRGFDVRTGKQVWAFHVMPAPGTAEAATWGGASDYSGNMGAWGPLSADDELGYVYVPLSGPTNPPYGGHRPGANLYSNSLVALDARTGRLVWQYQTVHHDLWDYDNVSPPVIADLRVDRKRVKAVILANKNGFLFVFDRVSGKPVWPIEERPVPASTVPGEQASPTQPFPSKPEPFDRFGLSDDDLIDFTPELRAEAKRIRDHYVHGPMFMPPSVNTGKPGAMGSILLPSDLGSAGWNTGTFDPETGRYYAVSTTFPNVVGLVKANEPGATIAYRYEDQPEVSFGGPPYGPGPQGLPLTKPPYGRITAYDMNKGDKLWVVANGDGPRDHPLLKPLGLPQLGHVGRPVALVTRSLLFLGEGSAAVYGVGIPDKSVFRAYDKGTGKVISELGLPAGTTGGVITYEVDGKQIVLVPIGSTAFGAAWVAMGLK